MIWLVLAVMVAVALGFLLAPMLRPRRAAEPERLDYDLTVYRDQLTELDADVARGVVSQSEANEARLEIERRMLRAAPATAPAERRNKMAAPAIAGR